MLSVSTQGSSTAAWRNRNGGAEGGSRVASVQGRRSGEIMGITEEEEEEEGEEEGEVEVVDFGKALGVGEEVVEEVVEEGKA